MSTPHPDICPHCGADFNRGVEIKTSNPLKCGNCYLPLALVDRHNGVEREWHWQEVVELAIHTLQNGEDRQLAISLLNELRAGKV